MKKAFLILASLVLMTQISNATTVGEGDPNDRALSPLEKRQLIQVIQRDAMFHGILTEAKRAGETCKTTIEQAAAHPASGIEFHARINCSLPADELTGGGVVLMIEIDGRAFGDLLDQLQIRVSKAG